MNWHQLARDLYGTDISTNIRVITWIIPTVQSIHILAIAALFGAALVMELRLAGLLATDERLAGVVRRHLPWMYGALGVLLVTGLIMTVGEPNRTLVNAVFWSKMALVVLAFLLTLAFRLPVLSPQFRAEHKLWTMLTKPVALVSLVVWVAVIFCGRWIAYATT
jgi:hypothetical protein